MIKKLMLPLLTAALLAASSPADARDDPGENQSGLLVAGTGAPMVPLSDLNGNAVDFDEYLGEKPVVIIFWSIYCDSCVDGMLSLQKLENKYRDKGLLALAVNGDTGVPRERIRRFIERLVKYQGNITYPLLLDLNAAVSDFYNVGRFPTLVLLDRAGQVSSYTRGIDRDREAEFFRSVEKLLKDTTSAGPAGTSERSEFITVRGEAGLCGFYDSTGWRKSFSGSDSREQELEHIRELSRRDATRRAVTESIRLLGIRLYSDGSGPVCVRSDGIHLSRDPFDTKDPVSNLLSLINYSDFYQTLEEQEILIDTVYYTSRQVRVKMESLQRKLESLGYLFTPRRLTLTYVNMNPLVQKAFVTKLLRQSLYIGQTEDPVLTPYSASQVFHVHTSSQGFADEILGMEFEKLKVFVEEVTSTSMEIEVWESRTVRGVSP